MSVAMLKVRGLTLMLGIVVASREFWLPGGSGANIPFTTVAAAHTPRLLEKRKHFSAGIFLSLNLHGNIRRKEY